MDKRVIELAKKIVKEGRDPASLRGLVEKELILKSQKPHRIEVIKDISVNVKRVERNRTIETIR